MTDDHFKKGLITGIIAFFIVGTAPVIANSRPFEIDFYLFAAMTNFFELVIFLPLYILERRKFKFIIQNNFSDNILLIETQLSGWKKNKKFLLVIGLIFTVVPVLNF